MVAGPPRPTGFDPLGFEQADRGFGEGVVVGVAHGSDGRVDASGGEAFGERDGGVLTVLRPRGFLIVSTNANDDKHELDDLWAAAAADVLGTSTGPRRISLSSRFPLDDAQDRLRPHVRDIYLIDLPGAITVTEPQPVLDHLSSYQAWAHQTGVPFEPTLHRVRERLTEAIDRDGSFVISGHGGILVCRR